MNRLDVRNLSTSFETEEGVVRAVADVSFSIRSVALLANGGVLLAVGSVE